MRTIGRRWPRDAPRGDYPALCQICGVKWRRSQLTIGAGGLLVCPDDEGDTRVAAPPRVMNDFGTTAPRDAFGEESEGLGVVL